MQFYAQGFDGIIGATYCNEFIPGIVCCEHSVQFYAHGFDGISKATYCNEFILDIVCCEHSSAVLCTRF